MRIFEYAAPFVLAGALVSYAGESTVAVEAPGFYAGCSIVNPLVGESFVNPRCGESVVNPTVGERVL